MMRTTCKAINCFSNVAPRATLKAGTVEWWNGGMVEWWNGGMVENDPKS